MSSGASSNPRNSTRANNSKGSKVSLYQQTSTVSKYNRNGSSTPSSNNKSLDNTVGAGGRQPQQSQQASSNDPSPSIVSNKQKANPCDKLLSMFDGSNHENNKSILRVNLIKKSSRPSNVSPLIGRRPLHKRETIDVSKTSSNDDKINNSDLPPPSPRITDDVKESKLSKTFTIKQQSKKGDNDYLSHYEEAKKSQKLVVSLIKDISKTVGKEDLDEMLKEINLAIGEIQQGHKEPQSRRKQNNHSNRLHNNKIETSCSEASNSRDPKEVDSLDLDDDEDDDSASRINGAIQVNSSEGDSSRIEQNSNNTQELLNVVGTTTNIVVKHNDDSSSDIRGDKIHKQLMELSSDEDTGEDRKPSSSSRLRDRCLRITSSHAKYISPHRKRSLEERLNRAQEAREKFLEYRANKFRDILKKVEEMRAWKEEDTMNLKTSVQTKLQKAAEKRKEQLDKIIRKAHDEESKVNEIQFINNLEAQNKRHDMNSRKKEFEARLQDLQDERQRRFEEKQAKEVAAEERRKTLEAERKAKLIEIQQRRKLKTQKVEQQQQVKEKKRLERNRNREQKITAIKEAYNAGVQTLKKRINQKQEQSERRHEVNLRLIRQKAFELSIKRYNSFVSESNASHTPDFGSSNSSKQQRQEINANDTKRLQLKPFNTKKFCNLCKETISSESALFSHLRSEVHHSSINEHYENTMLTTNEAVEIHNLRHIVDTDEPLDCDNSSSQQSSRASSLVNYYHSSYLSQANGGICMSESDRNSLLAIEKKCRKLRHKLIVAGKPFNRDWFIGKIRAHLAQLLIQQRVARNQTTNIVAASLANTIDLSANNVNCQHNKPFYLKINRITRELIGITTDQRISGGGLMPAGIIHSVDRLLADLNKQLTNRKVPQLMSHLLQLVHQQSPSSGDDGKQKEQQQEELNVDQLAMATKMIEFYAIDTLFLYDIVSCLVSILRRIVPNVSLISKLPSTVASHCSTLIDPISLNSYYCHRSPILSARIYIKMIGFIKSLCENHADLCYIIFQSNNMINLSDILSYRLGFIIGNESPASSISGSSSAATLSAHTIDSAAVKQNYGASSKTFTHKSPALTRVGSSASGKFQVDGNHKRTSGGQSLDHNESVDGQAGDKTNEEEDEDLWERAETYKRTEEIVDDMTAGLCKLLATVTETILSRPLILLNQLDKQAFDQRSDDFISYMVSVGIVDTESVIMSHIHQQQNHHQHNSQQQPTPLSASQSNISSLTGSDKCSTNANASSGTVSLLASNHCGPLMQTTLATIQQPTVGMASNSSSSASLSTSNKIINFTTSCIQFVTSLVKLVIAKLPPDEEQDNNNTTTLGRPRQKQEVALAQQDPTQLLVTLKMTQLSGVLTLVYDMLVQAFNSLTDQQPTFVGQQQQQQQQNNHLTTAAAAANQPAAAAADNGGSAEERQLALALHSLRLINYLSYIDVQLLQQILASDEMLPLQLRHVCSYLISYLVQSQFKLIEPSVANSTTTRAADVLTATPAAEPAGDLLKNELLNEIILLLGHFAYLNQTNQLMLKSGRRPTIIEQLVQLPFDYFSRTKLKLVLMPTLISCTYLNDQICSLVSQELSLSMLISFIEDQLLGAQLESKQQQTSPRLRSLVADELTSTKLASNRWRFERRFAKSKWLSAKKYFHSQQAKMRLETQ